MKYKHYVVAVSTVTAMWAYGFQPLAGSLLQVQAVPESTSKHTAQLTVGMAADFFPDIEVLSIRAVGLSPDYADLNAFSASAGVSWIISWFTTSSNALRKFVEAAGRSSFHADFAFKC
jgi:hypothetical protein